MLCALLPRTASRCDTGEPENNMAVYTLLDHKTVMSLVATYGLGKLNKMVGIPVGSVNTHYLLEASKGKVILKIDEAKSFADAERELSLLRFLRERGFRCPQPLV